MKIQYNSPTILTFSFILIGVHVVSEFFFPNFSQIFFAIGASFNPAHPIDYFRLFSHVIGHSSWQHLFGNLTFILLLGPLLEEKYSSFGIIVMIMITAMITGMINVFFFSTGLLGASGIVFMFIVLSSLVDLRKGFIPLTFIFIFFIFVGTEIIKSLEQDNVSQMAHIVGGGMGALFGFKFRKVK